MKRPALLAALLCSLSWICVSGSDSETVEVEEGKNVTLVCSSVSTEPTTAEWFRVVDRTKPSCIASMFFPQGKATNCPGFKSSKFKMTANVSAIFLQISRVDFSDSGLYFCGFYINKHTTISTATLLNVAQFQDDEVNNHNDWNQNAYVEMAPKINIILVGLCVLLTISVVVLGCRVKKLKTAVSNVAQQETREDLGSDHLNYAALTFRAQPKRKPMRAPTSEQEPPVIYSAPR